MFGPLACKARKRAGKTQTDVADAVSMSRQTYARIEMAQQSPTTDQVARIAAALGAPDLLAAYCRACPVCTALMPVRYPTLDNVPLHPAVVATKGAEEAREAAEAFDGLFRVFDRNDWASDPDRREVVVSLLVQIRDVEVAIRTLYQVLFVADQLPLEVLDEVQRRQYAKCVDRGYCRPSGTEG